MALGLPSSLLFFGAGCLSVPLLLVWRRYGETHSRYWAWSALWVAQMGLGNALEAEGSHPLLVAYSVVAMLGAGFTLYLGMRAFVGLPLPDQRRQVVFWALALAYGLAVGYAGGPDGIVRVPALLVAQICLVRSLGWLWQVVRREAFGGAFLALIGIGLMVVLNVAYPFSFQLPIVKEWGFTLGGNLILLQFLGLLLLTVERVQAQWRHRASSLIDELAERAQHLLETGRPALIGHAATLVAREVERRLTVIDADLSSMTGQLATESGLQVTGSRMRQAVSTSSRLIAELLNADAVETVERVPVDLRALVAAALPMVTSGDVRVQEVWPSAQIWVSSEPQRLAQIVLNLLQNAVEAMPGGGTLTVEAELSRAAAVLRLSDTGGGMTAAMLERAFEPYYTTKPTGTGLGLPVVRSLLTSVGGDIVLASEPGRGSSVTIRLPAVEAMPSGDQVG